MYMYPRSGENLLLILKLLYWSDSVAWFDHRRVLSSTSDPTDDFN